MADLWKELTNAQANKLQYDIKKFFRTYYKELRKQIGAQPDVNLPAWFRGGRQILTSVCKDGVVIVHRPYGEESQSFPDRPDSFTFNSKDLQVKELLATYIPPTPEGQ